MTLTTKNTIKDNRNFDFQKYTILLVDDNPTNLELVVDYLEDYGLTIAFSRNPMAKSWSRSAKGM